MHAIAANDNGYNSTLPCTVAVNQRARVIGCLHSAIVGDISQKAGRHFLTVDQLLQALQKSTTPTP